MKKESKTYWFLLIPIAICVGGIGVVSYDIYTDIKNPPTEESSIVEITEITSTISTQPETNSTTYTTTTTYEVTELSEETTNETQTTPASDNIKDKLTYIGMFVGTYFGDETPLNGGSGRELIDCSPSEGITHGSVASKYVYENFGYNVGGRTKIWIEFSGLDEMNGWYTVDDCNADAAIIDFYFADYSTCPWQNDGTIAVNVWIE